MTNRVSVRDAIDAMNTERQRHERLYRNSDRFFADVLDWFDDFTKVPDELLAALCNAYSKSTAYTTVIDDAINGEISWE
jgi:hypothetical protein